jgi:hypothetical protein
MSYQLLVTRDVTFVINRCVCVCVCERERERERAGGGDSGTFECLKAAKQQRFVMSGPKTA